MSEPQKITAKTHCTNYLANKHISHDPIQIHQKVSSSYFIATLLSRISEYRVYSNKHIFTIKEPLDAYAHVSTRATPCTTPIYSNPRVATPHTRLHPNSPISKLSASSHESLPFFDITIPRHAKFPLSPRHQRLSAALRIRMKIPKDDPSAPTTNATVCNP